MSDTASQSADRLSTTVDLVWSNSFDHQVLQCGVLIYAFECKALSIANVIAAHLLQVGRKVVYDFTNIL